MRRLVRVLALIPVIGLSAAGCLRYEGDIAITPEAQVSGTLEFGIEKSVASLFGLTSLDDLQGSAQEENDNSFCSDRTARYVETATEFVVSCSFTEVGTKPDDDIYVARQGDEVILTFRYNADADAEPLTDPTQEYGSMRVAFAMPGPITAVDDEGKGQIEQTSANSIVITGKASSIYRITVTSSCTDGCSTPSVPGAREVVQAAATFSGGRVSEDTVFPARKQPYTIKRAIRIPEGITVTVRPGARIIWAGKAKAPMFVNEGDLLVKGTKKKPIIIEGSTRGTVVDVRGGPDSSTVVRKVRFRS